MARFWVAALAVLSMVLAGCTAGGNTTAVPDVPQAVIAVLPGDDAQSFTFDASASTGLDVASSDFAWSFGDGTEVARGVTVQHTFGVAQGRFTVSLVATSPLGAKGLALTGVTIAEGENAKPMPMILDANRWLRPGTDLVLDASPTMDPEGDPLAFEWLLGPRDPEMETAEPLADGCAENTTLNYVFSTGCLDEGQAFSLTLDRPGTYLYHCHPHPWMKARIVVADDAELSGLVNVDIASFAYGQRELRVQPGTTVTWTNQDPIPHTATVEAFASGTAASTEARLAAPLEPGDYVARLVVNDGTGSFATQAWGVRVSDDAPEDPQERTFASDGPLLPTQRKEIPYPLEHRSSFEALLSWTDPVGQEALRGTLTLEHMDVLGTWSPVDGCSAATEGGDAEALGIRCIVEKGDYRFVVAPGSGAIAQWELGVRVRALAAPEFSQPASANPHGGH